MLLRLLPHFCLHSPTLQVYFVTDGHPINNFEFFRPFIVGLGYPHPTARMPYRCANQAHQRGHLSFLPHGYTTLASEWTHCCFRALTYP